jgi:hypothetical protein
MPLQAFVFRHRPTREASVQIAKRGIKGRLVITTAVIHPTPYDGIEHPRQIVYPPVYATAKLPIADFLSDGFGSSVAYAGTEVDKVLPKMILRPPGSKCIAQIVELLIGIVSSSIIILTVDDVRLVRMKLQPTLSKAPLQRFLQVSRLLLAAAMAEDIVSKTLKRYVRMVFSYPPVERIMKEQISQQG